MTEGRDIDAAGALAGAPAAAAAWFARAVSGDMSDAETEAFVQWRAADAAHEAEYQSLLKLWRLAGRVPATALHALATPPMAREALPRSTAWPAAPTRRAAAFAMAAGVALLGGGSAAYLWRQAQPIYTAQLEAGRGEHRKLVLPDGSVVEANTQTRLEIRQYRDRRVVVLARGEASFDVARDAARPFTVQAGAALVRVTGTSFAVRLEGDRVRTTVTHGSVEVRGVGAGPAGATPLRLSADQATTVAADGTVAPAVHADVAAATAWREGRLVFDDTALVDVLAEVARYNTRPIRLADEALGRLRLSSTFRINDTDALLAALPLVLPVRVLRSEDGSAEIAAR